MSLFSLRSRPTLGVYGPPIYRPPKTTFNNREMISMKFDILYAHRRLIWAI